MLTMLLLMAPAVYAADITTETQGTGNNTDLSCFNLPLIIRSLITNNLLPLVTLPPCEIPPFEHPPFELPPCEVPPHELPPCILPYIIPYIPPCILPPCLYGSLTVTKTLSAPDGFDMNKQFYFTLKDEKNCVVAEATLGNGGSATFNSLKPGIYTIMESNASVAGYNLAVSVSGAACSNGGTLTVTAGPLTVAFQNTYVKQTGSLTITKTLDAPAGFDMNKTFDFTVRNAANDIVATATFGNGGNATFNSLDLGTYTITESDASVTGYNWDVSVSGAATSNGGTLTIAEGSQTVAFTNTYAKQTGDLTITKTLCAPCNFNKCKLFTFTIRDSVGNVAASTTLKGGKSTTIYGLPVGTYTVTESDASVSGYSLTVEVSGAVATNGGSLTVTQGTQQVTFKNIYKKAPCNPS